MSDVWTVWLIYFLAASTASVVAISIGWRGQKAVSGDQASRFDHLSDMSSPSPATSEKAVSDAAETIRATVGRMIPTIHRQRVHLDLAAEPGHLIRLRPGVLGDVIEEFVSLGLHAAVGGHLLLTAAPSGGWVDIVLSDDQPAEDAALRQSQARRLAQRVAMYGGTLDVVPRPNLGTTMTLRLAAATERPAAAEENEACAWVKQSA